MRPVVVVNFKTYLTATGENAVRLARLCEAAGKKFDVDMRVAVQAPDIYRVASAVKIPVYAEHVDPIDPGRNTGFILPEDVKAEGGVGTLLNHSEHPLAQDALAQAVKEAHEAGLLVIICAPDAARAREVARLAPEFVAVEPPELISGMISVSSARPGLIKESVLIGRPVLVGAGVHTAEDLRVALRLGAAGVLLASGVAAATDPQAALEKLLRL